MNKDNEVIVKRDSFDSNDEWLDAVMKAANEGKTVQLGRIRATADQMEKMGFEPIVN